MNVTATLDSESVTIVSVQVNGSSIYITYVDGSSILKAKKKFFENQAYIIATGATVN